MKTCQFKKMGIKGSGSISDLAFNVFSVWRNKPKEALIQDYQEDGDLPKGKTIYDIENMPDSILVCSKSRNVEGAEGKFGLFYDSDSLQFLNARNTPVVDFFSGCQQHLSEADINEPPI